MIPVQTHQRFGRVGFQGIDQRYPVQAIWKLPQTIAHIAIVIPVIHTLDQYGAVDFIEIHVPDEIFHQPRIIGPLRGHIIIMGKRRCPHCPYVYVRVDSHVPVHVMTRLPLHAATN